LGLAKIVLSGRYVAFNSIVKFSLRFPTWIELLDFTDCVLSLRFNNRESSRLTGRWFDSASVDYQRAAINRSTALRVLLTGN
jgi:hypothetical protein